MKIRKADEKISVTLEHIRLKGSRGIIYNCHREMLRGGGSIFSY
jgi:hypothetical protein